MEENNIAQRFLKRFADSKFAWDRIQGPIYNRLIIKVAYETYERIVEEIEPPDNARVLDVGSGPGYLPLMFAERYPTVSVTGLDYSSRQVRFAERLRARKGINNCGFIQGDAMDLPFEDSSFDIVVSMGSIKYWPEKEKGLKEIKRVLVPDGLAFIGEADAECADEDYEAFFRRFRVWYIQPHLLNRYMRRVIIGQSISLEEADRVSRAAGFTNVQVEKAPTGPFLIMMLRK